MEQTVAPPRHFMGFGIGPDLYAGFTRGLPNPSRGFMGTGPIFGTCQLAMDRTMLDLAFITLGAALFLGALIYARACAQV